MSGSSGNTDNLYIYHRRHTGGTNWNSTEVRLQKQTDATLQHYISFRGLPLNGSVMELGYNNNPVMSISTGSVGIGEVPSGSYALTVDDNRSVRFGKYLTLADYDLEDTDAQVINRDGNLVVWTGALIAGRPANGEIQAETGDIIAKGSVASNYIKLTPRNTAPDSPAEGAVYYSNATKELWVYDGTEWVAQTTKHYVGEFYGGGVVFWVDESGEHGLICAKNNQNGGNSVRWFSGTPGNTQAKGDGPFAGETNTAVIIAAQVAIGDNGNTYAARICNELQITENGKTYGDWYLPSKSELDLMYQNKATIDATAIANGGVAFVAYYYWSSTEGSIDGAWACYFNNGSSANYYKNSPFKVRAIRSF
jgi:hypothetical protein